MEEVLIMNAALASLLAPLPSSISSKFDQSLTKQSEKTLSQTNGGLTTALPPPPDDTLALGDRVTILSGNSPPAAPPLDGLGELYTPFLSSGTNFALGEGSVLTASFTSVEFFSFEASFTHLSSGTHNQGGGKAIGHLLQELDGAFQDLLALAPGQGKRLGILARMLAVLNPEHSDKMLQTILDSVRRLSGIGRNAPSAPAPDPVPVPLPTEVPTEGPTAPTQQVTTEMVHFELDFEMEKTLDVQVALGTLSDEGIVVQTAEIHATQRIQIHIEFTGIRQEIRQSDPLVLDLLGDGLNLTGITDGTNFDIDADGETDRMGFVRGDDAFLALDRNGNGRIDNGRELFGDQHGARNGFEELAKFDGNRDGRIDSADSIFSSLRLLHDIDFDGRVQMNEISTLLEQDIQSIDLNYDNRHRHDDAHGNTLAERSSYLRTDGSRGDLVDAWIGYEQG